VKNPLCIQFSRSYTLNITIRYALDVQFVEINRNISASKRRPRRIVLYNTCRFFIGLPATTKNNRRRSSPTRAFNVICRASHTPHASFCFFYSVRRRDSYRSVRATETTNTYNNNARTYTRVCIRYKIDIQWPLVKGVDKRHPRKVGRETTAAVAAVVFGTIGGPFVRGSFDNVPLIRPQRLAVSLSLSGRAFPPHAYTRTHTRSYYNATTPRGGRICP